MSENSLCRYPSKQTKAPRSVKFIATVQQILAIC